MLSSCVHRGKVSCSHVGDQRVHLHGQAQLGGPVQRGHRQVERPWHATQPVVAERVRPVEAQGDRLDPGLLHLSQALERQVGGHGGRQRRADTPIPGRPDQQVEVGSTQRVATGEHDVRQRPTERGDVVEDRQALLRAQLPGRRVRHRGGPAVPACQPAGGRQLPVDDHRSAGVDPALRLDGSDASRVVRGHRRCSSWDCAPRRCTASTVRGRQDRLRGSSGPRSPPQVIADRPLGAGGGSIRGQSAPGLARTWGRQSHSVPAGRTGKVTRSGPRPDTLRLPTPYAMTSPLKIPPVVSIS